jgi:prepilin-type N-terminal cleavage/methylation domain-containing protein
VRKDRGFSIVELIVVMAVIGILAALIIPRYTGFSSQAMDARVISLLDSIRGAVSAYEARNGSFAGLPCGNSQSYWDPLVTALAPYVALPSYSRLLEVARHVDGCQAYAELASEGYMVALWANYPNSPMLAATPLGVYRCTGFYTGCSRVR